MTTLPTREQMLANATAELEKAFEALDQAAAWLRSDWTPVGSSLTMSQAERRQRMFAAIRASKEAILEAQG